MFGGGFNNNNNQTQTMFGNFNNNQQQQQNIFGQQNNATPTSGGGLFGNMNQQQNQQQGLGGGNGIFGGLNQQQQQNQFGGGTNNQMFSQFGQQNKAPTSGTGGLFSTFGGGNNQNPQQGGGFLGNNQNTGANPGGGGLFNNNSFFGNTQNQQQQNASSNGGLFSQNQQANTGLGGGGLFGTSTFGQNNNSGGGGPSTAVGGLFGNNQQQNNNSIFGQQNTNAQPSGGFFNQNNNNNNNQGGLFSQNKTTPFGLQQQSTLGGQGGISNFGGGGGAQGGLNTSFFGGQQQQPGFFGGVNSQQGMGVPPQLPQQFIPPSSRNQTVNQNGLIYVNCISYLEQKPQWCREEYRYQFYKQRAGAPGGISSTTIGQPGQTSFTQGGLGGGSFFTQNNNQGGFNTQTAPTFGGLQLGQQSQANNLANNSTLFNNGDNKGISQPFQFNLGGTNTNTGLGQSTNQSTIFGGQTQNTQNKLPFGSTTTIGGGLFNTGTTQQQQPNTFNLGGLQSQTQPLQSNQLFGAPIGNQLNQGLYQQGIQNNSLFNTFQPSQSPYKQDLSGFNQQGFGLNQQFVDPNQQNSSLFTGQQNLLSNQSCFGSQNPYQNNQLVNQSQLYMQQQQMINPNLLTDAQKAQLGYKPPDWESLQKKYSQHSKSYNQANDMVRNFAIQNSITDSSLNPRAAPNNSINLYNKYSSLYRNVIQSQITGLPGSKKQNDYIDYPVCQKRTSDDLQRILNKSSQIPPLQINQQSLLQSQNRLSLNQKLSDSNIGLLTSNFSATSQNEFSQKRVMQVQINKNLTISIEYRAKWTVKRLIEEILDELEEQKKSQIDFVQFKNPIICLQLGQQKRLLKKTEQLQNFIDDLSSNQCQIELIESYIDNNDNQVQQQDQEQNDEEEQQENQLNDGQLLDDEDNQSDQIEQKESNLFSQQNQISLLNDPRQEEQSGSEDETEAIKAQNQKQIQEKIFVNKKQKQESQQNFLPILNPDYEYYPTAEEIQKMTKKELENVENFKVKNKFGSIEFTNPVNLVNLNLKNLIQIKQDQVDVYNEDDEIPPEGQGLNCEAIIVFNRFGLVGKYQDPKNLAQNDIDNLIKKVKLWTKKHGMKLLEEYHPISSSNLQVLVKKFA